MMCNESKVLFVHIPKCGGTFVESIITPGIDWHERGEKHLSLSESIDAYGRDAVEGCYRFAIVRNPFERIVSAYLYYRRHRFTPVVTRSKVANRVLQYFPNAQNRICLNDFKSFVSSVANGNQLVTWAKRDLRPASEFCDAAGGIDLHDVFRLEEMAECTAKLAELGFKASDAARPVNASPTSYDYRTFYDEESARTVLQIYARDFSRFYPHVAASSVA